MHPAYADRQEAGERLAEHLREYAGRADAVVLGLPRGGVPVAAAVARVLKLPLDIFLVRKLGHPLNPEFAIGAIAEGGHRVLNEDFMRRTGVTAAHVEEVAAREAEEMRRRARAYRGDRSPPDLRGRTVILVDDGLATGATVRAAAEAARAQNPQEVVIAAPVGARDTCDALRDAADKVVCARTPEPFDAVGLWYEDFSPTSDEEVIDWLGGRVPAVPLPPEPGEWP
jgi:putative phosphoribosyl transferase